MIMWWLKQSNKSTTIRRQFGYIMAMPILSTKLYIPPTQPNAVQRARLLNNLQTGVHRKLTLVSAPAGFGKTTLISAWVESLQHSVAWLSLDSDDSDATRFIMYLIAALRQISEDFGDELTQALESPQPPPIESIITLFINSLMAMPTDFLLVLDDYHIIDSKSVDQLLTSLVDHMPPQMHLVILTREDPQLPLARLRARGQLTEIRAAELRFTPNEASEFLNQVMGLTLSADDIAALETRTEGWIAGLQLAAISMQGESDTARFIESLTGSHHFILDYLLEEVLQQQPERIQNFLLATSILDRLCGSLCEALIPNETKSGQQMLEALQDANLFLIPLDNERRWYRYHHLFADLLRQRLASDSEDQVIELHIHASEWYEANGFELEAFQHAAAAIDIERTVRLVEADGMPLYYRGASIPIINWLETLPKAVLDATPSIWVMYAAALTTSFRNDDVEPIIQSAEAALQNVEMNDKNRDLIGQVAAIRATVAAPQYDLETMIEQSNRALEYLSPENLPVRTTVSWLLGYGHYLQGDRVTAKQVIIDTIDLGKKSGNMLFTMAAATNLGILQQHENDLHQAAQTFREILHLTGDPMLAGNCEAYLGLARIHYQWNDLTAAEENVILATQLAAQIHNIDTPASCDEFYAQLKLANGEVAEAEELLAKADQFAQQRQYEARIRDIATTKVLIQIHHGNLSAATYIANEHDLPLSQARVQLAQGDSSAALTTLEAYQQQMEAKGWLDEQLKTKVLQSKAFYLNGDLDTALSILEEALFWAKPSGYIRLFLDESEPLVELLSVANAQGIMPDYTHKLLTEFSAEQSDLSSESSRIVDQPLIEPLSDREMEILQLVAEGLSNREISDRLYLALSTVKGHNRNIYGKLGVERRTEAVARARELGLIKP